MNRFLFYCLFFLLFVGCKSNNKKEMVCSHNTEIDYIIDSTLTIDAYMDYSGYIPQRGMVPTPQIAVDIAKSVWTGIYGIETVEKEKPYFVNLENNLWIVEGSVPNSNKEQFIFGGSLYIEINKITGEIIKVFHSK